MKTFKLKKLITHSIPLLSAGLAAGYANAAALEEIVVTATKRAESLQTVPVSISALGGSELELRGALEFEDYANTIPNLSFGQTGDGVLGGRSISLRGIQGNNTTGFYIDDTPVNESMDPRVIDLERIEVIRGPSGTLYGGRSLGGTIRQITKQPNFEEVEGKVRVGVSTTDESDGTNYYIDGSVNMPLSDKSALRITAFQQKQSGVYDKLVGDVDAASFFTTLSGPVSQEIEDVDDETAQGFLASWLWQATDKLSVNAKIIDQNVEIDGFPFADGNQENFDQIRQFNIDETGEDDWTLYALTLNYEADYGTFTSATSYFDRSTFETEDSSEFDNFLLAFAFGFGPTGFTPVPSPIFQELQYESKVQEFRFSSNFGGAFEIVLGAFYSDTEDNQLYIPPNIAVGFGAQTPFLPFGDLVFTSDQQVDNEELGLFGEFYYDFNDKLTGIFGVRFYDTETSFTRIDSGLAAGGFDVFAGGSQEEDGVNLKVGLEYEASDSLFLFANIAEGFRIGGANGAIPTDDTLGCPADLAAINVNRGDTDSYDSDDLISYEFGAKKSWDRANLNATAFYIDIEDIQQQIFLNCGFGFIGNIGSASSQGIEIELTAQPTDALSFGLNVGYTDAEFTETVAGIVNDGDRLQQVPELNWAANFMYEFSAFAGFDAYLRGDYTYVDDSISTINEPDDPRARDSYDRFDLKLGFRNDKYEFAIFGKNLSNEIANISDSRSIAAEVPGRPRFVTTRPRTIGVEFKTSF